MSREIKESDWKLLRQLHSVALERFCRGVLLEVERITADTSKSFHERYVSIYKVIERRDKEMSQAFDDLRRSTAVSHLAAMKSHDLLTDEEFSRFSEETRRIVMIMRGKE